MLCKRFARVVESFKVWWLYFAYFITCWQFIKLVEWGQRRANAYVLHTICSGMSIHLFYYKNYIFSPFCSHQSKMPKSYERIWKNQRKKGEEMKNEMSSTNPLNKTMTWKIIQSVFPLLAGFNFVWNSADSFNQKALRRPVVGSVRWAFVAETLSAYYRSKKRKNLPKLFPKTDIIFGSNKVYR